VGPEKFHWLANSHLVIVVALKKDNNLRRLRKQFGVRQRLSEKPGSSSALGAWPGHAGQLPPPPILLLAVLLPFCMILGARGFAPAVGLAGFFCLRWAAPPRIDWPGLGVLGGLVVWATISSVWSPAPNLHIIKGVKDLQRLTYIHLWLQLFVSGAFVLFAGRLTEQVALRSLRALAIGLLVGMSVLFFEMLSRAALYQAAQTAIGAPVQPGIAIRNLAQSGFVVAILAWPIGMALYLRGWKIAAIAVAAFVPLSTVLLRGFAPMAGLVISGPVFLAVLWFGRPAVLALLAIVVFYFLMTPWLMIALERGGIFSVWANHLPPSWEARTRIWAFVSDKVISHPWRGWGLDASRTFPGVIPLHPHDAPLQLWFELGLPGIVLGSAFFAWLVWRCAILTQEDRLAGAVSTAAMTVYLVISAVGFGLWQEWWICCGALSLATCVMARKAISLATRHPFELSAE
jgi:O-antigen ligase